MIKLQRTLSTIGMSVAAFLIAGATAFAQTSTASTSIGVPTTGAGGDLTANILLLALSALLAISGTIYLMRTGKA